MKLTLNNLKQYMNTHEHLARVAHEYFDYLVDNGYFLMYPDYQGWNLDSEGLHLMFTFGDDDVYSHFIIPFIQLISPDNVKEFLDAEIKHKQWEHWMEMDDDVREMIYNNYKQVCSASTKYAQETKASMEKRYGEINLKSHENETKY